MDDDEPRALQALLRYLYTLDCTKIFRRDDPLFSDVERDLDVFAIADKYDLLPLKKYIQDNLVLFYSTYKTPPLDPKGWSAKNQSGFAKVLTKLYQLEIHTTDIRKAVAAFIVHGGSKVMSWHGVQDAVAEDGRLASDLIVALLEAKKAADSRTDILEREMEELEEQLAEVLAENEQLQGDVEHLAGLVNVCDYNDFDGWTSDASCGDYEYNYGDDAEYLANFWGQL